MAKVACITARAATVERRVSDIEVHVDMLRHQTKQLGSQTDYLLEALTKESQEREGTLSDIANLVDDVRKALRDTLVDEMQVFRSSAKDLKKQVQQSTQTTVETMENQVRQQKWMEELAHDMQVRLNEKMTIVHESVNDLERKLVRDREIASSEKLSGEILKEVKHEVAAKETKMEQNIVACEGRILKEVKHELAAKETKMEQHLVAREGRMEQHFVACEGRMEQNLVACERRMERDIVACEAKMTSVHSAAVKCITHAQEDLKHSVRDALSALQEDGEAMQAKAIARDKDILEQISTLESTVSDLKENAFQSKEELTERVDSCTDRVESCRCDVNALKEYNENKANEVNDLHAFMRKEVVQLAELVETKTDATQNSVHRVVSKQREFSHNTQEKFDNIEMKMRHLSQEVSDHNNTHSTDTQSNRHEIQTLSDQLRDVHGETANFAPRMTQLGRQLDELESEWSKSRRQVEEVLRQKDQLEECEGQIRCLRRDFDEETGKACVDRERLAVDSCSLRIKVEGLVAQIASAESEREGIARAEWEQRNATKVMHEFVDLERKLREIERGRDEQTFRRQPNPRDDDTQAKINRIVA